MYFAVSRNNRVLVENKLIRTGDTYEIDFDDFEEKAKDENTKLLILCSPHNPSGRVWSQEELERIGRICIDNHVLIVSDEIILILSALVIIIRYLSPSVRNLHKIVLYAQLPVRPLTWQDCRHPI